jgi:hypothetical protein
MPRRPEDPPPVIVQRFVDAFNKHDGEGLHATLAANVVVAAFNGGTESVGAPALRAACERLFEEKPLPRLAVTGRVAHGDCVVQHETVTRGLAVLEKRIAIYTVLHEQVTRVDLIR